MIEDKTKPVTPDQELFCRAYTRADTQTFSNATLSYAEAYGIDFASLDTRREIDEKNKEIQGTSELDKSKRYCAMAGSRLMTLDNVRARITSLMMELFNDDSIADSRIQRIILTGKDADAINAAKVRNDLKQRIVKKLDVTTQGRPLSNLSDEDLLKLAGE